MDEPEEEEEEEEEEEKEKKKKRRKKKQQAHPLGSSPAHLFDVRRPGKSFVQGHPEITNGIDQIDWLPEKSH